MTSDMYGAQGRVGNKTYYRSNGKTVAREIVAVKNPKTNLQTLQRVIAKQVNMSYKMLKNICDHSFEGITNGANCAAKFRKLNMRNLRAKAAELQAAGQSLAQFYNFQPISSEKWVPGALILSHGQLPKIAVNVIQDDLGLYMASMPVAENTYAGVINTLGLRRGDQLTFLTVEKYLGEYQVRYIRVILDPRNEDGSGAALSTAFITDGAITKPSRRNQGAFSALEYADGAVRFCLAPNGATLVAAAVIASRKDGDEWLRSNAELAISEAACGSDKCSLWDAIESSYASDDIDLESDLYLNNAGQGGAQGETQESATPSTDPTYSNTAVINGVSQNIAGGSASVTAPITSIVVNGTALADAPVTARIAGADSDIQPTSKTATAITFSGLNIAAGGSITVKKNGTAWFTVTGEEPGGDGPIGDAE